MLHSCDNVDMAIMNRILGLLNYSIAIFMAVIGVATTAISAQPPLDRPLDALYGNHMFFIAFGVFIFLDGFVLLIGQLFKRSRLIGMGLFGTYIAFLCATVLQFIQTQDPVSAAMNFVAAVLVGILYLRWKMTHDHGQYRGLKFIIFGARDFPIDHDPH